MCFFSCSDSDFWTVHDSIIKKQTSKYSAPSSNSGESKSSTDQHSIIHVVDRAIANMVEENYRMIKMLFNGYTMCIFLLLLSILNLFFIF